jgi:hypothetical protein
MATQLTCDMCGDEPAIMMQSNLGDGSTITVGPQCMIPFYRSALAEMERVAAGVTSTDDQAPQTPEDGSQERAEASVGGPGGDPKYVDAYEMNRAELKESRPDMPWPPGEHSHHCGQLDRDFTHHHTGGSKPHAHPCEHELEPTS